MTAMSDSLVAIFQKYLVEQGGIDAVYPSTDPNIDWQVYQEHMPDMGVPDNAIGLYETSGRTDGRMARTGESIYHPGLAVRVRALTPNAARVKLNQVRKALDAVRNTEVLMEESGAQYILNSVKIGPVLSLGVEKQKQNRFSYSTNSTVTLEEVL